MTNYSLLFFVDKSTIVNIFTGFKYSAISLKEITKKYDTKILATPEVFESPSQSTKHNPLLP